MSDTQTPFFTICVYGLMDIFYDTVGASDFDIDSTNFLGQAELYLDVACGHHETVSLIMNLRGYPSIRKGKHKDPLLAACANGHCSIVKHLLTQKGRPDLSTDLEPALRISFPTGNGKISNLLLNTYLKSGRALAFTDRSWILEGCANRLHRSNGNLDQRFLKIYSIKTLFKNAQYRYSQRPNCIHQVAR